MDSSNHRQRRLFAELHQLMPRQAPGSDASTRRALAMIPSLPADAQVVDMGCGPGAHLLLLAQELPDARLIGIDLSPILAGEARDRIITAELSGRVTCIEGDMLAVDTPAADLIWCEGAAYSVGVERALATWRERLRAPGYIAYTDAVWLREDPPVELARFWAEYPGMTSVDNHRDRARSLGYQLLGDFVLPTEDWNNYYDPLQRRIEVLRQRYPGDAEAEAVLAYSQQEIDLYRRYRDYYGYAFFVLEISGSEQNS